MHLDDEQVERMGHGELAHGEERSVREHLAKCAECRGRVQAAGKDEAEAYALLCELDHAPPPINAADIAARARRRHSSRIRWAAGLLLAVVAGSAAMAAPRLPLRGWLRSAVERITAGSDAPQEPAAPGASDAGRAGIALNPGNTLAILFTSRQSSGEIRVSLTADADVFVRTATGAATFTSDGARLVIDNKGSNAAFDIRIPRAAPRVDIRLEGKRIFLKELTSITAPTPMSRDGSYVLRLSP